MAQRTLKRMALEPICWDALQRKNMTVSRDVLVCTKTELVQQLDVSSDVVENMIDKICKATCPEVRTVNAMCLADAPERFLPTGLDSLDDALHGGLPCASICEVVGPAGAGKTQFCLKACILAMLDGGCSIYIDTESRFSAERLCEIAQMSFPDLFEDLEAQKALAQRCLVYSVSSTAQLQEVLNGLEEVVIERGVRLVVIDSIACLVRREFGRQGLTARQHSLSKQAQQLKFLAESFAIPVVVSNQVTTKFGADTQARVAGSRTQRVQDENDDASAHRGSDANENDSFLTAALGTLWSHCVNTRLVLDAGGDDCARILTVAKSPLAPVCYAPFEISAAGIVLTSELLFARENHWNARITALPIANGPREGGQDANEW